MFNAKVSPILESHISETYSKLTIEQEQEFVQKAQEGDDRAKAKLINSILPFIVSYAKRYVTIGETCDEFTNQGIIAFHETLNKFDASQGNRFITALQWDLKNHFTNLVNQTNKLIPVPMNIIREYRLEKKALIKVGKYIEAQNLPFPTMKFNSFDAPATEDGLSFSETISDISEDPDLNMSINVRVASANALLDGLDDGDKKVIEMIFGLNSVEHTLKEVGDTLGISREGVRLKKNAIITNLKKKAKHLEVA